MFSKKNFYLRDFLLGTLPLHCFSLNLLDNILGSKIGFMSKHTYCIWAWILNKSSSTLKKQQKNIQWIDTKSMLKVSNTGNRTKSIRAEPIFYKIFSKKDFQRSTNISRTPSNIKMESFTKIVTNCKSFSRLAVSLRFCKE